MGTVCVYLPFLVFDVSVPRAGQREQLGREPERPICPQGSSAAPVQRKRVNTKAALAPNESGIAPERAARGGRSARHAARAYCMYTPELSACGTAVHRSYYVHSQFASLLLTHFNLIPAAETPPERSHGKKQTRPAFNTLDGPAILWPHATARVLLLAIAHDGWSAWACVALCWRARPKLSPS